MLIESSAGPDFFVFRGITCREKAVYVTVALLANQALPGTWTSQTRERGPDNEQYTIGSAIQFREPRRVRFSYMPARLLNYLLQFPFTLSHTHNNECIVQTLKHATLSPVSSQIFI